jgi:acyl carrier protein
VSTDLRHRIAAMIEQATGGQVEAAAALQPTASLTALGVDSLSHLRLIDAIEGEYGIETELSPDGRRLDTVDAIAAHLTDLGAPH